MILILRCASTSSSSNHSFRAWSSLRTSSCGNDNEDIQDGRDHVESCTVYHLARRQWMDNLAIMWLPGHLGGLCPKKSSVVDGMIDQVW